MLSFPNAKINLGLHVTGKRKDGYHEIETCMVPIPLFDALEIIPGKKTEFQSTGLPIPGKEADNLILKGLKLMRKDFNDLPHVHIHLHKNIPMGAGLGGGSADGAYALNSFNTLFDLHLESWFLEDYAAQLGSDCPFFIENTPKIATGRGEILEPADVDLKEKWILLINPSIHIGTKEAYQGLTPQKPVKSLKDVLQDRSTWKENLVNDFERSIFEKYPQIKEIKDKLYGQGAFYSAMSGSGATVFGLFETEPTIVTWPEDYFTFKAQL
ncbi:4-(cytidine 5'-diphospho)-2-C-methyl-D-erythritol kinase [Litoribacter alkaliphilus]|uniref:4-diphosphocytidyl-2-C-methyl-D-erythritol kinase n=1 Tax=Litoribacter ruber TaxID=702568 RepID=A0AAP2G3L2_9BACT|nr:4-(cytidine 5'-diphospho)-2-C-methyl-D-erythritol kinase [Litoribacter alkaliphilus]MBS9522593.1 4-(cytidine 5'-diphospho)-2-C-methyl-D-erythritol kinase [Litoribacter alkaliphilus]